MNSSKGFVLHLVGEGGQPSKKYFPVIGHSVIFDSYLSNGVIVHRGVKTSGY